MAKTGTTRALGLYVGPNQLEGPQDGAYVQLKNCVIRDKDVIEPRFGVTQSSVNLASIGALDRVTTAAPSSVTGALVVAGTGSSAAVYDPYVGTRILTSAAAPETWLRNRFADARGRTYLTTDLGLYRVDSDSSSRTAAVERAYSLYWSSYDASGFLAANYAVMYRATWTLVTADGSELEGPPSARMYLRAPADKTVNAGGLVRTGGNLVTATTTAEHEYVINQVVNVNVAPDDANFADGNKTITTIPTASSFTYSEAGSNTSSANAATVKAGAALGYFLVGLQSTIGTNHILRIYRSEAVTPYTGTPAEDVYKVYEARVTSTDVSNGYIIVQDNTPEVLLGEPAYFSPSVEGEGGSNEPPPRAVDICAVGSSLIAGNLREPHQLEIRLIATGGSAGLIDTSTVVFTRSGYSTLTLTATVGDVSGGDLFPLYSGTTSAARDVEKTALALCQYITSATGNDWLDAFYVSKADDPPGIIRLVVRDFAATAFTVSSSRASAWSPTCPTSGNLTTSKQTSRISQVAESKPGQPDAWPPLWTYEVGEPNEKLLRVLAVRDNKAIIIKERSCWIRSGVAPNVRVDLLDDTLTFAYPNSAAALDGTVYVLSSQGVMAISEGGVAYVGGPVSQFFDFLERDQLSTATADVWGVVDKSLGCYLLFFGTEADSDTTSRCLVFNPSARAWAGPWEVDWTAYARPVKSGTNAVVGLPDCPRVANGNTGGADVRGAAKTATWTVVTQPTATTITVADASGISVGDLFQYTHTVGPSSTVRRWVVTAVSGVTVTFNTSHGSIFTPGSSTLSLARAFECVAETVPLHLGGTGSDAQVSDVVLLMDKEAFESATVEVAGGDVGQAYLQAKNIRRWGFGDNDGADDISAVKWGDYNGIRPERCAVPVESQRAPFHSVRLRVKEAGATWRLHGIQFELQPGTIKGRR